MLDSVDQTRAEQLLRHLGAITASVAALEGAVDDWQLADRDFLSIDRSLRVIRRETESLMRYLEDRSPRDSSE